MIRIIKGEITLECETQAEVQIAFTVLENLSATVDVPPLPEMMVPDLIPEEYKVRVNAPAWRVGGPSTATLKLVETESNDSVPQCIPVASVHLDVLEAVMLFPEGVPCKGIEQLLGLNDKQVNGRTQSLKRAGLIERIEHSHRWRATTLARRAKLVRA